MTQKAFDSNEFEWKDDRLCHAPTGAFFRWANANSDSQDVWVNPGSMTDVLPDGTRYVLRVRPGTFLFFAKFSDHEAYGSQTQETQC
jgi:hypothetical protein